MTKYIFITGGVVSSLGKGITTAALAVLLEKRGLKVSIQKLDPYINVDPGTMSPFEHGEVYVTEDGYEADLDLGHYERFSNGLVGRHSNATTGSIYSKVIQRERAGEYLGQTVQVIPHVTDTIKEIIEKGASKDTDIAIIEIGGTAGDIESLPFLEAIRQFGLERPKNDTMYVHLTLLPYLNASGEMKTKPTQQSVGKLREIGIQPDALVCRCEKPMDDSMRRKISLFCNVRPEAVIQEIDVPTTIYEVPLDLQRHGLDQAIAEHLNLPSSQIDMSDWENLVHQWANPEQNIEIGIIGKYIELHDAYKSIYEALSHAGTANKTKVHFRKISAESLCEKDPSAILEGVSGILVPGGFGERGLEGKISAIKWARENNVPTFGICLGMQAITIEFARHVAGIKDANTSEVNKECNNPVIDLMAEQKSIRDKGGTMRLGAYACKIIPNTKLAEFYGAEMVFERHRHRWEFNNNYKEVLEKEGLTASGIFEKQNLVEVVELSEHDFFIGVQYHPEFKSKPLNPHPLFKAFISAALKHYLNKAQGKHSVEA
jgi:CTP synthase